MNAKHQKVIELYQQRVPLKVISSETKYSIGYIYSILNRYSVPRNTPHTSPANVKRAVAMYQADELVDTITRRTGISVAGLYFALKSRHIPLRQDS